MRSRSLFTATVIAASGLSASADALPITVNFDVAQAGYTPTGSTPQVLTTQFASIGIVFQNAVLADLTTCGTGSGAVCSEPVVLYGDDGTGRPDTTPDVDISFVDPADGVSQALADFFSVRVSDGDNTTLSAYDAGGSLVGSVTGGAVPGEVLTLSGLGAFSRVNITTPTDPTGYDDLVFNPVAPVPLPAGLGLLLGGLGLLAGLKRRPRTG